MIGREPLDIFIDRSNTIYAINENDGKIHIWNTDGIISKTIILPPNFEPWGLFVTVDGSIYIGSDTNGQVKRWTSNGIQTVVMNASDSCAGLFVDLMNHLYCSLGNKHKIVKRSLDTDSDSVVPVAGTGIKGSASNMLNGPRGIFVTVKLDLYIADCLNHRIQFFRFERSDGITVVGSAGESTFKLSYPTAVFLDADDYLFVVDNGNHRIIALRSNGFSCVIGCSGDSDSTSDHLHYPYAAAFDSYGNIFVVDQNNHRIQKFTLMRNTSIDGKIVLTERLSSKRKE